MGKYEINSFSFVKLGSSWFCVERIHAIVPQHSDAEKTHVFLGPCDEHAFEVDASIDECIRILSETRLGS